MATCYRCGRPISSEEFKLRRRVKTGESLLRRYPNPQINSLRTTYGVRLVCAPCARAIDWAERRRNWKQIAELIAAVVLLIAALLSRLWH